MMLASPGLLEACTCDLTEPLGLTQPMVTHHLRKLAGAGLVVADRRVGNFTYYRVALECTLWSCRGAHPDRDELID